MPRQDQPEPRSPLERLVVRDIEDQTGRPLSARARQSQRAVDSYLRGAAAPRWMERLNEIERGMKRQRRRLEREREQLLADTAGDPAEFALRWEALAHGWRFDELNELIRQHNDWYPVERDLPMDLRTRDYVRVNGRSYRREELGPDWILAQFPARASA